MQPTPEVAMTGHRARWSARSCGRAALSSESSDDHQLFTGAPWQSLARCQQRDWWAHAWHGDSSAHRFQVRAAGAIRNVLDGRALTQLQCNGQQLQCTVHTVGSCFLSRCMHSALLLRGKDAPCYVVPVLRRAGTELPCSRLTVRHRGVRSQLRLFIRHHQIVGEGSGQVMMLGATFLGK